MRNVAMALAFLAAALFSTSVFAAQYGSAGCGLGSLVFSPGTDWKQIFAATTNGTFASQTFGITHFGLALSARPIGRANQRLGPKFDPGATRGAIGSSSSGAER